MSPEQTTRAVKTTTNKTNNPTTTKQMKSKATPLGQGAVTDGPEILIPTGAEALLAPDNWGTSFHQLFRLHALPFSLM